MRVTIMGAGAGGMAAAVELAHAGHSVTLWNRSPDTLRHFEAAGGVAYEGVLGDGVARLAAMTCDVGVAVNGTQLVLVCAPTSSHRELAYLLGKSQLGAKIPVVLNPGHTGGALEFDQAFREVMGSTPPIAELSTLTYVARKYQPERVTVTGRAKRVRGAALPGGQAALAGACALFDSVAPVEDVLASGLSNVNMVLHPPGAVLAASWVEARRGDFTFYVDAMTPGVARVMRSLDEERRSVASAFGHPLPPLVAEMKAIGTAADNADEHDLVGAISRGEANRRIKAPDSLSHRYYGEDFGYGLLPFLAFARIAGVRTPVAESLLALGSALTGIDFRANGRTAERMGISGLTPAQLMARVRTQGQ
jgi:opine dehydrogenase